MLERAGFKDFVFVIFRDVSGGDPGFQAHFVYVLIVVVANLAVLKESVVVVQIAFGYGYSDNLFCCGAHGLSGFGGCDYEGNFYMSRCEMIHG
jgi:hypothetical protein